MTAQGLRNTKEVVSVSSLYKIFVRETGEQVPSDDMFLNQDGELQWIDILCSLVENPEDYVVKIVHQEKEKALTGLFPVWGHGVVHLARQRDGKAVCGVRKLDWESTKSISDDGKIVCIRCQAVIEAEEKRNSKRKRRAA